MRLLLPCYIASVRSVAATKKENWVNGNKLRLLLSLTRRHTGGEGKNKSLTLKTLGGGFGGADLKVGWERFSEGGTGTRGESQPESPKIEFVHCAKISFLLSPSLSALFPRHLEGGGKAKGKGSRSRAGIERRRRKEGQINQTSSSSVRFFSSAAEGRRRRKAFCISCVRIETKICASFGPHHFFASLEFVSFSVQGFPFFAVT